MAQNGKNRSEIFTILRVRRIDVILVLLVKLLVGDRLILIHKSVATLL